MGIPDHLTCLLRNLYAGQEATVRTRHGTMDWLQIGKGVYQGCMLSHCLCNSYAQYIMWNTRLDESQAVIKIAAAAAAKSLQSRSHFTLPSLGFSRQEHWSGLPFPSLLHGSEKWKWSRSVVPDSSPPHGLQPTRLLRPWDFPGKSTGVGCHCLLHQSTLMNP